MMAMVRGDWIMVVVRMVMIIGMVMVIVVQVEVEKSSNLVKFLCIPNKETGKFKLWYLGTRDDDDDDDDDGDSDGDGDGDGDGDAAHTLPCVVP